MAATPTKTAAIEPPAEVAPAAVTPVFPPDPNGATEAAFPAYPKNTTPDPASTAANATAPTAPK